MSGYYDLIGKKIVVRLYVSELTGRNKVEFFRELMDDLGITERFHAEPDATAAAQKIITEQWDKFWSK